MSVDNVKFKLAHPLGKKDAWELGLEERTYPVGSELTLPRAYALRLVGAGFVAGADPTNPETVNAALTPVAKEPAPAPAQTPASSAPAAPAKPNKQAAKGGDEE